MTKQDKIIEKLLNRPTSLRYSEIEKLFDNKKFKIEERKWSHKKITLLNDENKYIIIPIHNNDCKEIYKIWLKKFYLLTRDYE